MNRRPRRSAWVSLASCLATTVLLVAGCGSDKSDGTTEPPHPSTIAVDPPTAQLVIAETSQLSATIKDAGGQTLSGSVTWSSGSDAVATVSSTGLVTAVTPGSTTISANYRGIHGSANVTVQDGRVVGPSGSTVTGAAGKVMLQIPAQALGTATPITIAAVPNPPVSPNLVAGTAYEFGPSGTQFAAPVTIQIKYDPGSIPAGAAPTTFRVHRLTGTIWTPLVGSTVDTATKTVSGATTSFSTYAVLAVPPPIASLTLSAARLDLGVGETAPVTVTAKDADGNTLTGRPISWSSTAAAVATVSDAGVVSAVAVGSATIRASAEGKTAELPVTVYTANPALVLERILSQDGLAIALASNVLQSQLLVALSTMDGPDAEAHACEALEGGGSYQTLPVGTPAPTQVGVYYDTACTKPYIMATVTLAPDNTTTKVTIHGINVYTGLSGQNLGTLTVDETLLIPERGKVIVHGLGIFVPANGAAPVQLGLYCTVNSTDEHNVPCAGGVAQDFSSIGLALGTVTPLVLDVSRNQGVSFTGGGPMYSGPIGGMTLTAPAATTMEIHGGTVFATNVASGSAATFSLFPPTPTGWSLTDTAHDRKFQIDVVSNTVRNLVGHITEPSTGRILATITVDQSGTGTITYSDGSTQPITSWLLAN